MYRIKKDNNVNGGKERVIKSWLIPWSDKRRGSNIEFTLALLAKPWNISARLVFPACGQDSQELIE